MNNRLNIQDLAGLLSEYTGKEKTEVEQFLKCLVSVVSEGVYSDKLVKIKGLGTFKIIVVEKRESINVNTGERILIPAHYKFSFLPDKDLKELVNKPFSVFETTEIQENVNFTDMEESVEDAEKDKDVEDESVEEVMPETEKVAETVKTPEQIPAPEAAETPAEASEEIEPETAETPVETSEEIEPETEETPAESTENVEAENTDDLAEITEVETEAPVEETLPETPVEEAAETEETPVKEEISEAPILPEKPEEKETENEQITTEEEASSPEINPTTSEENEPVSAEEKPAPEASVEPSNQSEAAPVIPKKKSSPKLLYALVAFVLVVMSIGCFVIGRYYCFPEGEIAQSEQEALPAETVDQEVAKNAVDSLAAHPDKPNRDSVLANQPLTDPIPPKPLAQVKIKTGDRLTVIALKYYGNKLFWVYIYKHNKAVISDPNNVPVGTVIDIPIPEMYGINAKSSESRAKAAALQTEILTGN